MSLVWHDPDAHSVFLTSHTSFEEFTPSRVITGTGGDKTEASVSVSTVMVQLVLCQSSRPSLHMHTQL